LHVVSSIGVADPDHAQRIELYRDDPLIISPQAEFIFRTKLSTDEIKSFAEQVKQDWINAHHNVDDIGIRFRIFSRDAFSNVPILVVKRWRFSDLIAGTMKLETAIDAADG
jgi:hypothetical protein